MDATTEIKQNKPPRIPVPPPVRYLRDIDVAERYATTRTNVWRWSRSGQIPGPVRIGPRHSRWREDELDAHDDKLRAARDNASTAAESSGL